MNDNPIIPPVRNLPASTNDVQFVAGSCSSRFSWVYQEVVLRVKEKVASQLCTENDTKIERAVRQQLDTLLCTVSR